MISLDFDWQTNEFMLYCRTTQLREKSMMAYEQTLRLFERWCMEELEIFTVDNSEFIALIAGKLQLQLKSAEAARF